MSGNWCRSTNNFDKKQPFAYNLGMEIMIESELHSLFCRNFRAIRKAQEKTQSDLAASLGVARAYIAQIESGRRCPTLNTVERLAKALNVSVEDLLGSHTERLLNCS